MPERVVVCGWECASCTQCFVRERPLACCRLACHVPKLTDAMKKSAALCPDCREGHSRPAGQMNVQDPIALVPPQSRTDWSSSGYPMFQDGHYIELKLFNNIYTTDLQHTFLYIANTGSCLLKRTYYAFIFILFYFVHYTFMCVAV